MSQALKEKLITTAIDIACRLCPPLNRVISDTPPNTDHLVSFLQDLGQQPVPRSPASAKRARIEFLAEVSRRRLSPPPR